MALMTTQVMAVEDESEPVDEGVLPPPRELETAVLMNEPQHDWD